MRELAEETGITSVAVAAVSSIWRTYDFSPENVFLQRRLVYRGQKQKWVAVRFTGSEDEIDIDAKAGLRQEFTDWRWCEMHELPTVVAPFKRMVYTEVVREFAHLLGRG